MEVPLKRGISDESHMKTRCRVQSPCAACVLGDSVTQYAGDHAWLLLGTALSIHVECPLVPTELCELQIKVCSTWFPFVPLLAPDSRTK